MRKLLHKIMLDCNEATRLISIKRFQKLAIRQRIQLSLHLMACRFCNQFSKINDLIDDSMDHVCSTSEIEEHDLSNDKKAEFSSLIEKELFEK